MNRLVSPAVQAMNIIRHIGDGVLEAGQPVAIGDISENIGAPNSVFAESLLDQLVKRGWIEKTGPSKQPDGVFQHIANLTLDGWDQYEAEKRGRLSGNYGFLALKFGDPELDSLANFLKEQVSQELAFPVVDMRDVERAGVIDNIMRIQVRDSAFVIADLTHDNLGAYWEAGYAEGLGKPVVYICEATKFEERGTHFDTNHCTTIPWSKDNRAEFSKRLIATLRRSLDSESV